MPPAIKPVEGDRYAFLLTGGVTLVGVIESVGQEFILIKPETGEEGPTEGEFLYINMSHILLAALKPEGEAPLLFQHMVKESK